MVFAFIKVGEMADAAQVKPHDDKTHDQKVENGKENTEHLVSGKTIAFNDFWNVGLDSVVVEDTPALVSNELDCWVVEHLVSLVWGLCD